MTKINPKSHDALFKWLIASFTDEFFAHYFPEIRIGRYSFIDKEFISKYEALKESLHKQGVLSKKKMEKMIIPLRRKLNELSAQIPKAA